MNNFETVLAGKEQWIGGLAQGQETYGIKYQRPIHDIYISNNCFWVDLGDISSSCSLDWHDGVLTENTFTFNMPYIGTLVLNKRKS